MTPLVYVSATILCGLTLPRFEHAYLSEFSHSMFVSSALAALSAIASGIVYALALMMVQFSAVAYSPRLVSWFSSDPLLFHALGLFTATFGYAIAAIAWVDREGNGKVPLFSVMAVMALLTASMFIFMRLVQRLNELQITNVLQTIGRSGREAIHVMFPRLDAESGRPRPAWSEVLLQARQRPVTQVLRYADEPRVVTHFDFAALLRQAKAADVVIVLECAVGDTLVQDTVLLRVHGGREPIPEHALRQAIGRAKERTFEQDPQYPLRLLVDIAIRALSPAVNDPTTAVQAIDQIEVLLRRLGHSVLDAGYVADDRGTTRVVFPTPTWDDYLRLAFDEIRLCAAGSLQVYRRLRSAQAGLLESVSVEERRAAVQHCVARLEEVVAHSQLDAEDRQTVSHADRQGLGLSREP